MGRRYWVACFGNLLGLPLFFLLLAIVVEDPSAVHRILAATGLFGVGWGAARFIAVMQEEYEARFGKPL